MHIHFKVHGAGKKNLHGDGIALWYTRDRLVPGRAVLVQVRMSVAKGPPLCTLLLGHCCSCLRSPGPWGWLVGVSLWGEEGLDPATQLYVPWWPGIVHQLSMGICHSNVLLKGYFFKKQKQGEDYVTETVCDPQNPECFFSGS